MLAARSRCSLEITAAPSFEETIAFTLRYVVSSSAETLKGVLPSAWLKLGHGKVQGIRPRLTVADACSRGLSRLRLWETAGMSGLDEMLKGGDGETSLNFSPGLLGATDTEFKICVRNDGACNVDWAILFPNDLAYQPEPWAQVIIQIVK